MPPFPLGVHAFFYLWYGEPSTDGAYRHWNHEILPHWTEAVQRRFPHGAGTRFRPPVYLHSPYYPQVLVAVPRRSRNPNLTLTLLALLTLTLSAARTRRGAARRSQRSSRTWRRTAYPWPR